MFEEVTFPLGPRALEGQWMICTPDIIDEDKTQNYCIEFHVKDDKEDDYDTNDAAAAAAATDTATAIVAQAENATRLLEIERQISQEHFINLTFEAPATYRPGVPFSGKVKPHDKPIIYVLICVALHLIVTASFLTFYK